MINGFDNNQSQKPNPVWKWTAYALLFCAAGVIVLSLPTPERISYWITSYDYMFSKGLNWKQIPFAIHQQRLWERNLMCARGPGEETAFPPDATSQNTDRARGQPRRFAAFTGMAVRLQACWNGDVLVRTVYNDGTGRAVWVAGEGFELMNDGLPLAGQAMARATRRSAPGLADQTFDVICQGWARGDPGSGRVIRVISIAGARTRETINILTGQIISAETVRPGADCSPDQPG